MLPFVNCNNFTVFKKAHSFVEKQKEEKSKYRFFGDPLLISSTLNPTAWFFLLFKKIEIAFIYTDKIHLIINLFFWVLSILPPFPFSSTCHRLSFFPFFFWIIQSISICFTYLVICWLLWFFYCSIWILEIGIIGIGF